MPHDIDASFLALDFGPLAESALAVAEQAGAEHADFRFERLRTQDVSARDGEVQGVAERTEVGYAVRVLLDGVWGFASDVVLTTERAAVTAQRALEVARVAAAMTSRRVRLAAEPVHADRTWVSAYDIDPFTVGLDEKTSLLTGWTERLVASDPVAHAVAHLAQVHENKFYADLAGTSTTQQRVRLLSQVEVFGSDTARGVADSMRTVAPPVGRGWEHMSAPDAMDRWDRELSALPGLLGDKLAAPSVEAGSYDLVVHPSNLWLTIHESIGHATELDRALGYEANYAGTSFATPDKLGSLRYGSDLMHVTGDRTQQHGLATIGYDDDGVEGQSWDLVRDGVLVGYQLDRAMAHTYGAELNEGRSNGCAYADSPGHVPIQRMANVSLQPGTADLGVEDLIGDVERGLYVIGDRSWSIDMQRYNFQFTGQQFHLIRDGELVGQVRDAAYQATTTDFWGSMDAVGGPSTYELGGAFNCGKAQPGQVAAVSHGCPVARFRDVNVLNTSESE
ncbi:TldD/PmbA family protein [Nocardioidaceae bacterium]|nr:TldD/PmbA family protein [Nocardioidaceae bacterium]